MSIYQPKVLSETIISQFRPTRLAIKELAGMLYFCKSTAADIERYPGSGVVWKKRIKKYGKENIKTLWVSDWYYDAHEIQEIALHFSHENQIVESSRWANQKPEDGLNGGHPGNDASKRGALARTGVKHSIERNAAKSARQRGSKKSQQWLDNRPGYDKTIYTWINESTRETVIMSRRDFAKQYISSHTDYYIQATSSYINQYRKTLFGWQITCRASVSKSR
jgi:hypothetical protein